MTTNPKRCSSKPPGIWDADARTELDDLAEALDEKLAEVDEDVDTIGGLAFVHCGDRCRPRHPATCRWFTRLGKRLEDRDIGNPQRDRRRRADFGRRVKPAR
jgi:hypothetical protein